MCVYISVIFLDSFPVSSDILRMMQSSEDRSIYDKVVSSIFDEETLGLKNHHQHGDTLKVTRDNALSIQYTDVDTELRDYVVEVTREVFRQHCAKRLEIMPVYLLDESPQYRRFPS